MSPRKLSPALILAALSLVLGSGPGGSGGSNPLNAPPRIEADTGSVVATERGGHVRWRSHWSVDRMELDGVSMLRFTEKGSGRYSPFREPVRWELEALWTASPRYAPSRYEKKFFDLRQGHLLVTERRTFDWVKNTVHFQRIDSSGRRSLDRVLEVPPDTFTAEGIATALRSLPFNSPRPIRAHFLTDEPKVYRVKFKIGGKKHVKTGAGPVECFEVEMDFNLGVLNLFKAFVPDTRLWFSTEYPHRWIRYRGLESGRGTPVITRTVEIK